MANTRTLTNLVITLAATATLGVGACKKQPTTPPDGGASPPVEEDDDDDDAPADDDDNEEPATPLNKASFDETIHDHFSEVSDCYVAALERNAKLKGKLDAEFTIGDDGKVVSITAAEGSTLTDEGLLACINQVASTWTFARPSHGEMTLRYVYELAPG